MAYYGKIDNPLAEALELITGVYPPGLDGIYHPLQLDAASGVALEHWCQIHRPKWTTWFGVLEAAELLVRRSLENDNIEGYEKFASYFDGMP